MTYDALLGTNRPSARGPKGLLPGTTDLNAPIDPTPSFAAQAMDLESPHPFVRVQGEVDLATASELADGIARVLARAPLDLVLDLTHTAFMDCSGVSVIVKVMNHLPNGSRMVLRRPTPLIRRLFVTLGLDAVVVIEG